MASVNDIIGNYHLLEELDSGTFARVYKAQHTIFTHRIVAIKLMHARYLNSQKNRESFLAEARLLERLSTAYHKFFPSFEVLDRPQA